MNNKVIWIYWAGQSMSPARAKAYDFLIKKNSNCQVKLVSEVDFKKYEVKTNPIPKEFYLLSFTHQSDYVRSYLMHHYGGAYSDIKPYGFNFSSILSQLYKDSNCWGISYPYRKEELRSLKNFHGIDDIENGDQYLGYGCFAYKSKTDFTKKWLELNDSMLKKNSTELINSPGTYHPRAIHSGVFQQDFNDLNVYPTGYPFGWGNFIGNYQLAQKYYLDHFKPILPQLFFDHKYYR